MNLADKIRSPKARLWAVVSVVCLIGIGIYWYRSVHYPSTDNAYVGANIVQITPQITGSVVRLAVKNFSAVKKGQLLLEMDSSSYTAELEEAKAKLDLARQNVQALQNTILATAALVAQRDSEAKLAQKNYDRIMQLVKRKQLSLAEGDKAVRDLNVAQAALTEATNQWLTAKAQLGESGRGNAQIREAEAQLAKAVLNLQDTKITSPVNGYIVGLTVRDGSLLQSGITVFSIVDSAQWWVDANFKETDLRRIKEGQRAKIKVDIYPGHVFQGVVQSISRGSGAAFSLFPAENATGNWVKVTQRFPVRVYIKDPDPRFPLRIGASASVTINTNSP